MNARVTLADIAKLAGVSKAAVSMALNDQPQVSEDLRVRVKALAAKMGYRRDPALSLIAASRWRYAKASPGSVLAIITTPRIRPSGPVRKRPEKTLSAPLRWPAAASRAQDLGYSVVSFDAANYSSPQKLSAVLKNRGIRGVMFMQVYEQRFVDEFDWASFAAIALHDGYVQPPVEQFTPSYVHALRECWSHALAAGYRRPGLSLFHEMSEHYINFILPIVLARLQQDLPAKDRLPVHYLKPEAPADIGEWIREHRPDVVIGLNDFHYWALRELGLAIPGDLACVSMQQRTFGEPICPVAGVSANTAQLLTHGIERLDALLRHGQLGLPQTPIIHRMVGHWCDAESMPPKKLT